MMKRLLLPVFFSALLFTQLWAAEKLSLAVFEFQAMEGIRQSDAVQIGEVVLNELIRTEAFRVVEQSQISRLMEEMSFQLSSLTAEMIIEIGKRLDVDFILAGSIGLVNREIIIFLRILATEDGSYFLSESIKTSPDCVLQDVIDFSRFIAYRAGQRISGNVAKRIESLISLGKIKEAEDLIRNAKALRHEDVSIIILEDKIKIATVEILEKSYLKAVKENDIEKAVYLIDEIIRYGGDYSVVAKYIEEVNDIRAIREEEQKLKQLEKIETFLDREQLEEAEKELDSLLMEYANVEPGVVKDLKSRLQLLRGVRYFKRVNNEFKLYRQESLTYADSLYRLKQIQGYITTALENDPANGKYLAFIKELEEEDARIKEREKREQDKRYFSESGLRSLIYLNAETAFLFFQDPFFENGGVNGVYPALSAGGSYYLNFAENIRGMLQLSLLYTGGNGSLNEHGAEYTQQFKQISVHIEPGIIFIRERFDIQGGAGAALSVRGYDSVKTVTNTTYTKSDYIFPLGIGVFLSGRYNFSKILAAALRYRIYPTWYAGSGWFLEHSLMAGIHYGIR